MTIDGRDSARCSRVDAYPEICQRRGGALDATLVEEKLGSPGTSGWANLGFVGWTSAVLAAATVACSQRLRSRTFRCRAYAGAASRPIAHQPGFTLTDLHDGPWGCSPTGPRCGRDWGACSPVWYPAAAARRATATETSPSPTLYGCDQHCARCSSNGTRNGTIGCPIEAVQRHRMHGLRSSSRPG
jgi:hypothetical protein